MMQRNVESHFSQLPQANIQRSIFDRSCSYKTSFNTGDLIPFFVDEVLPGDTFDITTAKVIRTQTLLTPLMDNLYLDTFYFFVPNRLIWDHWKEFCGENTSGAWAPSQEYSIPTIAAPEGGFASGTLADYMGLPVGVNWKASDPLAPSALPFRAYALICDHFFRDENLMDPLLIPTGDANQTGVNDASLSAPANGGKPFVACRYHDYFSSALPSPQKGAPVGIPITIPGFDGGTFPVTAIPFDTSTPVPTEDLNRLFIWRSNANDATSANNSPTFKAHTLSSLNQLKKSGDVYNKTVVVDDLASADLPWAPANLATVIPSQGSSGASEVSFTLV